jgi:glycosyltransferase involved in cell wall biosynthesis
MIGVALLARGRRPAVVTFHLLSPRLSGLGQDLLFGRWTPWAPMLLASSLLSPLVLVGLTDDDTRRIRRAFPGCRVETVANAPPPPSPGPPIGLPFGPGVRLLVIGRLDEQKGIDRLLDALAREPMRSAAWSLCVVGDGKARQELVAQATRLGLGERVRFAGFLPGSRVLREADWLLAPSRSEGMPLTVLEAMEAGVPVMASAISSHVELLSSTPEAILPRAVERWSSALAACLDPQTRDRVRAAQARALPLYSRERQDHAYAALYRDILLRRR